MLILALDTTTRAGSVALVRDGVPLDVFVGDAGRTHAARLPGDLLDRLGRQGLRLADVDLFAVAAGPGSFTGLRIGIATIQGVAFALRRPVVGVSALDALAVAAAPTPDEPAGLIAAWMDAQRGEVYASLVRVLGRTPQILDGPMVGRPDTVLSRWAGHVAEARVTFIGDGALAYRDHVLEAAPFTTRVVERVPPLGPAIADLAAQAAAAGATTSPHAIRPLYVRRPDAELARERRGQGA